MILWLALSLSPPALVGDGDAPAPATVYALPRRDVTETDLASVFDSRWILPDPPRTAGADEDDADLVTRMKRLATKRWPGDDDTRFRSLGDLAAAAARDSSPDARKQLLAKFRREQPEAWRRWGEVVEQLLLDQRLRDPEWRPSKDRDDDGLFVADPWSLKGQPGAPWSGLSGNKDVHQAAAWILCDLEALKTAENDYAAYVDDPGSDYDIIYPVAGTHVALTDEDGRPERIALQIQTESDLPFPFGVLTCRMDVLYRLDDDGHLVTDIASTSDDFYWFAGRDVVVPLTTSDGAFAGFLVVRWFGFDVKGVPDGTGTRTSALRAGLGRLKRVAEALWAGTPDRESRTTRGAIPDFEVRGDRRLQR